MSATGSRFVRNCCWLYLIVFLTSWVLALSLVAVKARRLHRSPVELLFYQNAAQKFSDLTVFDPATRGLRRRGTYTAETLRDADTYITETSYTFPRLCYPAAGMCDYLLFMAFDDPIKAFLILVSGFAAAAAISLALILKRSAANSMLLAGTVLSLLISYPLLFLLERANVEGVIWVTQVLALTAFVTRRYWPAALLVALAAAMKLYPGIFLLLFLHKKRYKELAASVAAMAAINVLSLWLLGPTISQANADVNAGLAWMSKNVLLEYRSGYLNAYDHSLFAAVKQALHFSYPHEPAALQAAIYRISLPYLALLAAGFVALYWFRLRHLPLLNQILVLTVVEITLPFMSQLYTLVHLYFAWALFMLFLAHDVTVGLAKFPFKAAAVVLIAFAFLFGPTPHRYFNHSIVGQMQLCALIALAAVASAVPMRSSLFGDSAS